VDQQDELYICSFDGAIYKFVQTNFAGEHSDLTPNKFSLYQNYPNPFNPITTVSYDLPEDSFVNITIYDILGMKVKTVVNTTQDAGYKSVIWDATNDHGKPISAGVYLYQIQAGEFVQTKKMVLLK
jgi:flagellar hook assembly protein FlgD